MPWKDSNTVDQRTEFVLRALERAVPFTELCREYGVSRKTGYKWLDRYHREGCSGMEDHSRRPRGHPSSCTEREVCRLVALKTRHPRWGAKKIHNLYDRQFSSTSRRLSLSTVKRVLTRAGLVERRRRRRPSSAGSLRYIGPTETPNALWTIDFKGWWSTRDGRKFEPLTVCDYASRYILCSRRLADTRYESVRGEFERLFETYGLPAAIRMDNGSPWVNWASPLGLTRLSAWWVTLGIALDRIAPGRPDQNGSHERMHRDLSDALECSPASDRVGQQAMLDAWREEFNRQRPHEALGLAFPAERYRRSNRRYDSTPVELVYPGMMRRKVTRSAQLKLHGRLIPISEVFCDAYVGLRPQPDGRYDVYFGGLHVGEIDVPSGCFVSRRDPLRIISPPATRRGPLADRRLRYAPPPLRQRPLLPTPPHHKTINPQAIR